MPGVVDGVVGDGGFDAEASRTVGTARATGRAGSPVPSRRKRRRAGSDVPREAVEALDRELTRIARISGSLRLAVGTLLEALARSSGFRELGFAGMEPYVLERCERSSRWGQQSRALARKLSGLPRVRQALVFGRVNWSMALALAKVATARDEEMWLAKARTRTVNQMREEIACDGNAPGDDDDGGDENMESADPMVTLTITANCEDVWLFQSALATVRKLDGRSVPDGIVVDALIGEASSTLMECTPKEADLEIADPNADAQLAYRRQRAEWKREGEARCEAGILRAPEPPRLAPVAFDFDGPPERIDQEIRRIMQAFFERDIRIGELANAFWKADGWCRLGYGSADQYAVERVGMCLSSVKERQQLARLMSQLPKLEATVRAGALGLEAARLVSGIATPSTEAAWVERALERTIVHLREEVDIAEHVSRVALVEAIEPPDDELIALVKEIATRVATGASRAPRDDENATEATGRKGEIEAKNQKSQINAPETALNTPEAAAALNEPEGTAALNESEAEADARLNAVEAGASQNASETNAQTNTLDSGAREPTLHQQTQIRRRLAAAREATLVEQRRFFESQRAAPRNLKARGRATLRLRVPHSIRASYRALERGYSRYRPVPLSFLAFASTALLESHAHALPPVAYGQIYARDGHRCLCPMCGRSGVSLTPHHVRFRSQGGTDDDINVISVCVECHLNGVHEGTIVVTGVYPDLEWTFGRNAHTRVYGRRRVRASEP